MVKVTGPALSLGASKSLGNLLTFQKRRGGTAVYLKNKPGGREPYTPTYKQRDQRGIIGLLTAQWQSFSAATKAQWDEDAKTAGEVGSGYHYWLKKAQTNLLFYHGLAGYWSFNGPVGGVVPDLSGEGHSGTLLPSYPTNAPVFEESINAKFGKLLRFDGISQYVDFGNAFSLANTSFSICAWAKLLKAPGAGVEVDVVSKYFGNNPTPFALHYINGNVRFWYNVSDVVVGGSFLVSKWYFFVARYDSVAKVMSLYKNGAFAGSKSGVATITGDGRKFLAGAKIDGPVGFFFPGQIDEVRAYKRLLPVGEILKQYQMFRRNK